MAQDKITEIFDIAALEANKAKFLSVIKETVAEVERLGVSIKANTSISGASSNSQKADSTTKEMAAAAKEYTDTWKRLLKERDDAEKSSRRLEMANTKEVLALRKEVARQEAELRKLEIAGSKEALAVEKALAKQKADLRKLEIAGAKESLAIQKELEKQRRQDAKEQAEAAKNVFNLANAYDVLNAKHKAAIKEYQNAAAAQKLSSQEITKLKDNANRLGDQLVKIDSAVGNYRRNVGNYSSAWNGLGNSINQVARELPNFAQSMQLGFLAISNNLPILADEIANTRKEIDQLKKDGKDAPSLFNQIAKSIFSWQTVMVVGITILTKYGAEFTDMIVKLMSGSRQAVMAQEALNKTYRDTAVTSAIANVKQLGLDIQLAKDKIIDKDRVLKEYNDTIGKVAGEVKNWSDLEQAYIDNSEKYIQFTLLRAAANYAFEESAKKSVDALINAQKSIQSASKINPISNNPLAIGSALFSGLTAQNAQEESDQLLNIAKDFRTKAANIFDVNDPLNKNKGAGRVAQTKKDTEQIAKDLVDIYTQVQNRMNDFEQDEKEIRSRSLAYLRTQLEAGVISVSQYEKQKQDIIKNSEAEILRTQTIFLGKTLANYGFSAENTAKITELWQNKMIDLKQKETDADEAALKERVQIRARFDEINQKNQDEKDALEKLKAREKAKYIQDIAQETAAFIFTLLDAQSQKEISEFEKTKERISEEYDLKASAVDKASISDEERTARKLVLAAEEEEQQKKIDAEIRAIKRKQAVYDKAQALAQIAINTAVAISSPTNLALGGFLTPLIIGLGAAQAAIVLATPLPEYAKGKKETDSYEGLAIAGEAGTEMRIDKEGKLELLTKPTLIHTKRGDTILSNKQLMSGELGKHIKTEQEKTNFDELIRATAYYNEKTIKAIKNSPSNVIIDKSNYNLNIQRARV